MPVTVTIEMSEAQYEGLLLAVELQETTLVYEINEAIEIHLLSLDYLENDRIKGEGKAWEEKQKGSVTTKRVGGPYRSGWKHRKSSGNPVAQSRHRACRSNTLRPR